MVNNLLSDVKYIKHFRNISIAYYLFSFTIIAVFFIMYLISEKNNRSCQYGSTLYCNNEIHYNAALSEEKEFYDIVFKDVDTTDTSAHSVGYPYSGVSRYSIDYYFNTLPASITNNIDGVGVSFDSTNGASIYFSEASNSGEKIQAWTRLVLYRSDISSDITILDVDNSNNNSLNYQYFDESTNAPNISLSPHDKIIENSTIDNLNNTNEPIPVNWFNILNTLQTQAKTGCSLNNLEACACIDPSFISPKVCSQYYFNKKTSRYCPFDNPNCELCVQGQTTGCGYRFCRYGTLPSKKEALNPLNTDTSAPKQGYYQSSYNPGGKNSVNSSSYVIGSNPANLLTRFLDGYDKTAYTNSATNGINAYPQAQHLTFCSGTAIGKQNYTDNINTVTTKFSSGIAANYYPQFGTSPNFNISKGNFDF